MRMTNPNHQYQKIEAAMEQLLNDAKHGTSEARTNKDYKTMASMIKAACNASRVWSNSFLSVEKEGSRKHHEALLEELLDMATEGAREAVLCKSNAAASMIDAAAEMMNNYIFAVIVNPYQYNCCCDTTRREEKDDE